MQHDGRVTKAVEKIETGNGLESKPWKGGSRKCPDLDGGIATKGFGAAKCARRCNVGNALIWTEGLRHNPYRYHGDYDNSRVGNALIWTEGLRLSLDHFLARNRLSRKCPDLDGGIARV